MCLSASALATLWFTYKYLMRAGRVPVTMLDTEWHQSSLSSPNKNALWEWERGPRAKLQNSRLRLQQHVASCHYSFWCEPQPSSKTRVLVAVAWIYESESMLGRKILGLYQGSQVFTVLLGQTAFSQGVLVLIGINEKLCWDHLEDSINFYHWKKKKKALTTV